MMSLRFVFMAGVLFAATLLAQLPAAADPVFLQGEFHWFQMSETRAAVAKQLGLPTMSAPFVSDFETWQYQIGPTEEEGFSHQFVFRKSTGTLIFVTRNYAAERNVDELFPAAETITHYYPDAAKPAFSVRVRHLSGGNLLIAGGVAAPGQSTGQILLVKATEVQFFLPLAGGATDGPLQLMARAGVAPRSALVICTEFLVPVVPVVPVAAARLLRSFWWQYNCGAGEPKR